MTIEEIVRNKAVLIAQKKATLKEADGCNYFSVSPAKTTVQKSSNLADEDSLFAKLAINTTNIFDSHHDVHIPGLWNKSLKENKMLMHLQEHKMEFDAIISEGTDLKPFVKTMSFKELGYKYDGDTQVLIFESIIKRERNLFMFKQYANGYVKNHSVGMRYVKLFLAVNDEKYKEEFAVWNKYFPIIANKEDAEEAGYFWAVTEAKIVEGSAVPLGSNKVTPPISITGAASKSTPSIEPPQGTPSINKNILLNFLN